MNWRFQRTAGSLAGRKCAFTLLELLVVIAVIGVLTATILPALSKAKQRGLQTRCMSNLKQVGIAMQLYVNDNEDTLPGPVWSGAKASYDKNSSTELIFYLADYLDSQDPKSVRIEKPVIAEVFVCPAYQRYAPQAASMLGRKCYLLNDNVEPNPENPRVPPFGYPELTFTNAPTIPLIPQLKISQLESFSPSAGTFAITDVDWLNINPSAVGWALDAPLKPVHGNVRNELYFDWHVAAKHLDW